MAKPRQILTGAFIVIALVGAGFTLGRSLNKEPAIPAQEKEQAAESTISPNSTVYDISPPNKGRAYRAVTFSLDNLSGNNAVVYLPKEKAGGVAAGQTVLFHDKDNAVLNILGTVTSVTQGKDAFANIVTARIDINDTPVTPARNAATGEIITEKFPMVERLPLTALQTAEDGLPFLWEAVKQTDGSLKALKRTPDSTMVLNDDFVIVDIREYVSNTYLLAPDRNVQDGQTINVRRVLYKAPDVADDTTIAAARTNDVATYEQALKDKPLMDALKSASNSSGSCNTSCAPGKSTTSDFIAKIKSMAGTKGTSP